MLLLMMLAGVLLSPCVHAPGWLSARSISGDAEGAAAPWHGIDTAWSRTCQCLMILGCLLVVDAFSERQILKKNRGGALCTGADGPRAGAGRSAAWCAAGASLPDGRTVRALGPDGPLVRRGGGRPPAAPGSRSREGPRRGGEILGGV
jgi:hypothetical protein